MKDDKKAEKEKTERKGVGERERERFAGLVLKESGNEICQV